MSNIGIILFGILPLLIFVIIDMYADVRKAAIAAIVLALVELVVSLYLFGEIDSVTGFSVALVAILSITTFYTKSAIFVKLQPVLLGLALASAFIGSYIYGKPLLYEMAYKYQNQFPAEMQQKLNQTFMQEMLKVTTLYAGISLLLHAVLVLYAAFKMSNWWWLLIRGIGVYIFLGIASFLAGQKVMSSIAQ
ncbi:MAG: septation protein IspZ [Spirochaetota bacterium]